MKPSTKAMPLRVCARLTLAALATSTFSVTALAEQESLEAITITANRMPTENALAPNTVITRADIDRLQINDLPTLLSRYPGIDMVQNGGLGKAGSLFIRGTSSRHVLVLVDGVKWQSATSGSTALQDFPVEQIERIEIVRGPRSGIYGSEAIGGVIQIFTRKGKPGETKPYFSVGLGSKNTQKATAGVRGGNDATQYNLSYSYLTSNGIDALDGDESTSDHDGYRNKSLAFNVSHKLSEKWLVGANLIHASAYNEYDGTEPIYSENIQQVMGINSQFTVNDMWLMSFVLGESRDRSLTVEQGINGSRYNTKHHFASWTNTLTLSNSHKLNLGIDYDHDKIESARVFGGDYGETNRDNKAAFVSWQGKANRHEWLLSTRYDDNEAFGSENTGTADYGYWLSEQIQFIANAGTGFKVPTFNDLYYPVSAFSFGNPDVKPERSTSYGLGVKGEHVWGSWALNTYKTKIQDLINWAAVDPTDPFSAITPSNIDEAEIKGVEFELETSIAGWLIAFDASVLQPEDANTNNVLPRRSKRLANLHLDKQWNKWGIGASWKLRDHSYNDVDNSQRLSGYGLLDLRVSYSVSSEWLVRLTGQNMLNKDYVTTAQTFGDLYNYNSEGRAVMLSVHYQP